MYVAVVYNETIVAIGLRLLYKFWPMTIDRVLRIAESSYKTLCIHRNIENGH